MLAQNFKTAAELRIPESGYAALLKVLGRLEREEITAEKFTMKYVGEPECGAPGCILGHTREVCMEAYEALSFATNSRNGLENLFYPDDYPKNNGPYQATPSQAATALRSYLTTGRANWAEALA